jgi:predicted PurR-regulated permease PerM
MDSPQASNHARERAMRAWLTRAAKVFVVGALGTLIYIAHTALVPVALAVLLSLVLSGPVEALHRRRVPRVVSAMFILVVVLSTMGGLLGGLWSPAQNWFAQAPQVMATIQKKVKPIEVFMTHLDALRQKASDMNGAPTATPAPVTQQAREIAPALILDATGPMVAAVMTFIVVSLFLLAGGPPMLARMTAAFIHGLRASHVLMIIDRIRIEVGRFYLTTTLINIGLGIATAVGMWAWHMPTPYLWGAMAGVLNYIPYAGSALTLLVVTLVAAVSFDTLGQVLAVSATYLLLAAIEGQVAQPLLVGRRLEVNPLLIFLGLWFGDLFWGLPGVILATPALVVLKVIAENTRHGHAMLEFLGPNDQTPAEDTGIYRLFRGKS